MPIELWKMPVPATSLIRGPDFGVLPRRQCEISFHVENDDGEHTRIALLFDGLEAFKCTYLTSCSAEMFNTAYAKLVCLGPTSWLAEVLKVSDGGKQSNTELRHLMICFDDGPCYEMICRSFSENRSV